MMKSTIKWESNEKKYPLREKYEYQFPKFSQIGFAAFWQDGNLIEKPSDLMEKVYENQFCRSFPFDGFHWLF